MARIDRRRFLQVSAVTVAGAGLAGCGDDDSGPDLPEAGYDLGSEAELRRAIAAGNGSLYVPEAQAYVVEVPEEHRDALAAAVAEAARPGVEGGFVALWQKCPHQGCRTPYCESSGWFECPCHGSRFTPFGEVRRGPARRGMSYLPLAIDIDSVRLLPGPVDGLQDDVTDVEPDGPHGV
jgi:cytochrome b6-f complex iron-sulfur subunit